jgi:hypothetical protein
MGDNSFGHSIGIYTYWPAEWCADATPSVSTLVKTINGSLMQFIIHVPVELEILAWGTIPLGTASAWTTPIGLPSGVPMLLHQSPHYSKINDSLMQSIIHVPVELELLWGTIPSATALALATPIGLPSGVPMPLHQSPHYSKR